MDDKYTDLHCILVDERKIAQYIVVPYDTHIMFTSKTVFKKLASVFPPIPRHFSCKIITYYPNILELNTYKSVSLLPSSKQANEEEILQTGKKKNDTFFFVSSESLQLIEYGYKAFFVLEDETNEINALIIGKSGEIFFGLSRKDLVFNQKSINQKWLPSEFFRLIGQRNFLTFDLEVGEIH
ncbi:hypothetical protein DVH24_033605 [Malus domestica]|uniref:Uncharacterized protein n=1 Tax=Malus domestica TaxID=3750 RepID=A0A498JA76_MALDO|nr:hypothetical protein DVH24_033605 [Malus domestica]